MRTDSQARAAVRTSALRDLLDLAGEDRRWDAVNALLDLGVRIEEIEEAIRNGS